MAPRAINTATVSFGLVAIPIKVYSSSATDKSVHFNMLHKECGSRLKQQYVCPKHERKVERAEMVKGYEFQKGQFVTVTKEELKAAEEEATRAIAIDAFVPISEVDPLYFEAAYYLGPDKGGERPYRLLHEALRQTAQCAVARYAARGKQYLVLLRPFTDVLIMQQLRYAHEVKEANEIPTGDAEVNDKELGLALQLIDQIASDKFMHGDYHDEVQDRLEALVNQKIEGKEVTLAPAAPANTKVVDLMSALKASLDQGAKENVPADIKPPKQIGRAENSGNSDKAAQAAP